jgi:hypothetical protein
VAILNGVLYYNYPALNPGDRGFYAVDLRTGETLWYQNTTNTLRCAQVYNVLNPNQEGGIAYLWSMSGSTWYMYDAFTGNQILKIANVTSGSNNFCGGGNIVEGPNGELDVYVLDSANNWLAMWNSSKCIGPIAWNWRPQRGSTLNWQDGVQWNVTIQGYPAETLYFINSGVILATTGGFSEPMNSEM